MYERIGLIYISKKRESIRLPTALAVLSFLLSKITDSMSDCLLWYNIIVLKRNSECFYVPGSRSVGTIVKGVGITKNSGDG